MAVQPHLQILLLQEQHSIHTKQYMSDLGVLSGMGKQLLREPLMDLSWSGILLLFNLLKLSKLIMVRNDLGYDFLLNTLE